MNVNHSATCLSIIHIAHKFINFISLFMKSLISVTFLIAYKLPNVQHLNTHEKTAPPSFSSPIRRLLPTVALQHNVKIGAAQEQKLLLYNASSV